MMALRKLIVVGACATCIAVAWIALCVRPMEFTAGSTTVVVAGGGVTIWIRDELPSFVVVPNWILAAPFLVAIFWRAFFRRASRWEKRETSRLCAKCGYDLPATPDRCPECGNWVEAGPEALD
jgi:hypothetical protein